MRFVVLFFVLAFAACSTAADHAAALDRLVGQPEAELVRLMGVPARAYETQGHKFLAYSTGRTDYIPGGPFFNGGFGFANAETMPGTLIQRRCETTFDVVDGRVAGWGQHGDACF